MKLFLSLFIVFLIVSCAPKESILSIDLSDAIVEPKSYIVGKASSPIQIDGEDTEENWKAAIFSDSFIDIEGVKKPKYNTKFKMLWDENYLYVFAELEEPHIWGNIIERDAVIYLNNDFEVFIDPSNDTKNYGEIEINALGTVWDLLLNRPYRSGGHANIHWNLDELKSAVKIHGSINNPTDIDSLWTVEMAIPMKALIELKVRPRKLPEEGEQWRINFSRVNWDHNIIDGVYERKKAGDKFLPEYNWVWSSQKKINMHEPEKWGFLQFTRKNSAENIQFRSELSMYEKQVAYALFRETRFGSLKHLLKTEAGHQQAIKIKYSDTASLIARFYKTNLGFEFKLKSKHLDQTFIINEIGTLKIKE